ncbi:endonuclease NucS [Roseiarcaceae bacterium H3SJ34-1]|uniref:endonuclease NucS domain-containing protein n=1 Tax=Terripilifer ovatus TaxID=3032367 RepID=UPI003AB98655|nr:endonuclease NucS [Roseiarcaceae bacterium H3SJ34-1]
MFRSNEFRKYLARVPISSNSINSYISYLNKVDRALNSEGRDGIDELLEKEGVDAVLDWARSATEASLGLPPSNARSALKQYINFHIDPSDKDGMEIEQSADPDVQDDAALFRLEKEMQAAVRRQLDRLEQGLVAADGGVEQHVATGRIDILAKDAKGQFVVIELKAGRCPTGALEQALGYAQSLNDERPGIGPIRVILIASEFSDRTRAAAKRISDLQLKTYEFSLQFQELR